MSEVLEGRSCTVEVICDSISTAANIRLTTLQLRYWRPIHSELMTHRVFSRNARSSRAVPVVTILKEDMFIPTFGMNQKGMQAGDDASHELQEKWAQQWEELANITRNYVRGWSNDGMHKQWANRPLEWFGWIDVLVTSTDLDNWFALRDHPDAAPEIHELAQLMRQAMDASTPTTLGLGEWHLPYITEEEKQASLGGAAIRACAPAKAIEELKVLSAARCARLSYKPFDGNGDPEAERARYNKLVGSSPVHASPTEHQATPDYKLVVELGKGQTISVWAEEAKQGNFVGWKQARKYIPQEAMLDAHYFNLY